VRAPSSNALTLTFNATTYPYSPASPHKGIDFLPILDNKIYAPFSGTVILKPNNGNDGNGIYMYSGPNQFHGMLHTSQYLVRDGQQVIEGQPIAVMGYSGYVVPAGPLGMHLHWCVKQNGVFIDPLTLITPGKGGKEVADQQPYNTGDAVNIAELTGHDLNEVKSKANWNDVFYAIVKPYVVGLQRQLASSGNTPTTAHQLASERAIDALEQAFNSK
jgi:hypothetical protein